MGIANAQSISNSSLPSNNTINTRDNTNYQCMKTNRLELTTYIDLYTFTVKGKAYRKSSNSTSTYKTQHYGNTSFIAKQCKENAMYCGMSVYQDIFK